MLHHLSSDYGRIRVEVMPHYDQDWVSCHKSVEYGKIGVEVTLH